MNTYKSFCRKICIILITSLIAACGGGSGGSAGGGKQVSPDSPLTATLSVNAADPDSDALAYEWKVTAGTLSSSSGATVKWTVPEGGGLQFAYLTVSDGRGGYVERTFAMELGASTGPQTVTNPRLTMYSVTTRDNFEGATLRGTFSISRKFAPNGQSRRIYLPGEQVRLTKTTSGEAGTALNSSISGVADLYGEVRFPKLPQGEWEILCNSQATEECIFGTDPNLPLSEDNLPLTTTAAARWFQRATPYDPDSFRIYGHISLTGGSLCGIISEYKGKRVTATVTYRNETVQVNAYGDYALRVFESPVTEPKLTVKCEGLSVEVPVPIQKLNQEAEHVEVSAILANRPPIVSAIVGTANGQSIGEQVVDDASAPSSGFSRPDHFLTYKGTDTADSACAYYLSIGATPSCGAYGALPENAIRFDEWKRMRGLAPYDQGNRELAATYVNRVDLNLVRDMHGVKTGSGDYAFYVCNYPKPASGSAKDVDAAIEAARQGKNLVACVAMDYSVTQGTNPASDNYLPFVKFYIFGPSGSLISSVNLDGRGEKFVPGSCVVCHGGDRYTGRFPMTTFPINLESNGPSGNLGARFLPFDVGNYLFSTSEPGLMAQFQEFGIKRLNYLVRDIEFDMVKASMSEADKEAGKPVPSSATMALIDGWYASNPDPEQSSYQDQHYLPPAWATGGKLYNLKPATAQAFYGEIVSRYCRTCHVALNPEFDWDSVEPSGKEHVCGGTEDINMNGRMANSKQTFDLMWRAVQQNSTTRELLGKHITGCQVGNQSIFAPLPNPPGTYP